MLDLMTVRKPGKGARWYVGGKRVSQSAYDAARTGKDLSTFQTVTMRDGTIRHYCVARDARPFVVEG